MCCCTPKYIQEFPEELPIKRKLFLYVGKQNFSIFQDMESLTKFIMNNITISYYVQI